MINRFHIVRQALTYMKINEGKKSSKTTLVVVGILLIWIFFFFLRKKKNQLHVLLPYLANPYFISSHAEAKLQCSQQKWYFVTKIVLTYCETKLF